MSPAIQTLTYEMVEDSHSHGDYRVEAIDTQSDGEVYTVIFTGPEAQARAKEYLRWKAS